MGKAKGTALLGCVKYLRSRKDEARAILPEDLHFYLSETIATSTWYPESDLIAMMRALLELMPGERGQVLAAIGTASAQELCQGIYSHLSGEQASPSATFAFWASMHDTGSLAQKSDPDGGAHFELSDYADTSEEMCQVTGAFIKESLRLSGFVGNVEKVACTLDGAPSCRWQATRRAS